MQGKTKRLDAATAARQRGCRLDTLYQLLRAGRIPGAEKRDGRWLIPKSAIEARLRQRELREGAGGE